MSGHTATEIATRLDGTVRGDGGVTLTGFSPVSTARPGDLTFAENRGFFDQALTSQATAILVADDYPPSDKVTIRVDNARVGFAKALALFFPEASPGAFVHPSAVIDKEAQIHPTAYVGPHCVIGRKVSVGARAVLAGGNHLGDQCQIGDDTRLYPNVICYPKTVIGQRVRIHSGTVIGSDGFGYVFDGNGHLKIPQVGNVIVHDDVEIGANVTIDRGVMGPTVIGKGTKIDNLVQLGHNVEVGEYCIVVSQVGIAGSTKLGNFVTLAGQVGIAGHLKIGNRVTVAAQSGVMHDIPDGQQWLGAPAVPDKQAKRQYLGIQKLPDLIRRVKQLERGRTAQGSNHS